MKRRDFCAGAAVSAGILAGCGSRQSETSEGGGASSPKLRWRLVSSFPKALDTIYGAAETLANRVSDVTGGRFEIEVSQAGEYVKGTEVLTAVQKGAAPIGHSASYYYRGIEEALVFDTAVPFGMTARQQIAWLEQAGGRELLQTEVFDKLNIVALTGGNTGLQMGGWFKREINALADLKGLVMRIPGLGGEVMNRLGVTAMNMAGGEIFTNLERGTISATEWVGPYDDEKLGFDKAANNYYYPGWWEPGPSLTFYINKDAWEKLPANYQAALRAAAAEATLMMTATYDAKNPAALKRLVDKGVHVAPFPNDMMEEARKQSEVLLAELAANHAIFGKIHDHWKTFKDASSAWFGTAETAYSSFEFGGDA